MFYKQVEEYRFSMPKEHGAYLAFKSRLNEMGIRFLEEGGHTTTTISIRTTGFFDIDDNCDILEIVKEEK